MEITGTRKMDNVGDAGYGRRSVDDLGKYSFSGCP